MPDTLSPRPVLAADLERLLPLYELLLGRTVTLDALQARAQRLPDGTHWLIEEAGDVLAICDWESDVYSPPDFVRLGLLVRPEFRGQGHGSALLNLARRNGAAGITANVPDDESASLAWAEKRGFTRHAHRFESALNPQEFEPEQHAAPLPEGVTLGDMTQASDADWDGFNALLIESFAQTPDAQGLPRWSIETAREGVQLNSRIRPDWLICARRGGKLLGFTAALTYGTFAYNQMTAVATSARGLGLAYLLKVELLRRLKASGITSVRTHNHAANAPMLRVNEKLGYQKQHGRWEMRARL
ncbi:GNAT family N-acetyltransferase [Deinococcus sp.]|uniref:GNAT family N-acetyltransferase n=1 Tax=Deinococcus sp. TaxID=47478 RepID=UPI003B58EF84